MKIVIYTPVYHRSAGITYRVNMMKKALEGRFETRLICDKKENALRRIYRSLGSSLLSHKWMWEQAGERIAKLILSEKPDAAILVTDVTAGAIPFLKKEGILTVLSIEDLSAEWLRIANEKAIYQILQSYATLSDAVITVSGKLQQKLFDIGIEAKVVRLGLEKIFVSPQEAIEREKGPQILLHSGQIQFEEEKMAFESILGQLIAKYPIMSYSRGKFVDRLIAKFPEVVWYDYPTSDGAIQNLKRCSLGLIMRFRAHNPTRLYFHASMLQPIIAIGDNWVDEVSKNSIGALIEPDKALEGIERIIHGYRDYVRAVKSYAEENLLQKAYEPLIKVFKG